MTGLLVRPLAIRRQNAQRLAPYPLSQHRKVAALSPAALPKSLASPPKITRQGWDNHPWYMYQDPAKQVHVPKPTANGTCTPHARANGTCTINRQRRYMLYLRRKIMVHVQDKWNVPAQLASKAPRGTCTETHRLQVHVAPERNGNGTSRQHVLGQITGAMWPTF